MFKDSFTLITQFIFTAHKDDLPYFVVTLFRFVVPTLFWNKGCNNV